MGRILNEVLKARSQFMNLSKLCAPPNSIGVTYEDGVDLLDELIRTTGYTNNMGYDYIEIHKLLLENNREKIIELLNSTSIYGMKITVSDVTI